VYTGTIDNFPEGNQGQGVVLEIYIYIYFFFFFTFVPLSQKLWKENTIGDANAKYVEIPVEFLPNKYKDDHSSKLDLQMM
jgi:hypothetical protein